MFWQQKTFGKLFIDVKFNIFYLYAPEGGTILLKSGVFWGFVINQFEVLFAGYFNKCNLLMINEH
jgi:hypothetical protein